MCVASAAHQVLDPTFRGMTVLIGAEPPKRAAATEQPTKSALMRRRVAQLRELHAGLTWEQHLRRDGLDQFTETMAELLPDVVKS